MDGSVSEPDGVLIRDCNVAGNPSGDLKVTSTVANLQVSDCYGYNDQNTAIVPSSFTASHTAASLGYYGPSVVTWSDNSVTSLTLTLNGTAYSMKFGSVYLGLNDSIQFSHTPSEVTWIGK